MTGPSYTPPRRHTADTITDDELDALYATVRRLNRRAQEAESENASYRRAVTQWDVSERGTYIPHASLVAIGRAAGTDVLGSVRHLKHFERVEQAEAAIDRVRDLHTRNANTGDCEHCSERDYPDYAVPHPCPTIRALDGRPRPDTLLTFDRQLTEAEYEEIKARWAMDPAAVLAALDTTTHDVGIEPGKRPHLCPKTGTAGEHMQGCPYSTED